MLFVDSVYIQYNASGNTNVYLVYYIVLYIVYFQYNVYSNNNVYVVYC